MARITIAPVSYTTDPAPWDELFRGDPLQYPLGSPLDQEYSRAYAPHLNYRDVSLIATAGGRPIAGIQATVCLSPAGPRHIDFYGRPMMLRMNDSATAETAGKAARMLAEEFYLLQVEVESPAFHYLDLCPQGCLSEFATALLRSGCKGTPVYKQVIDLRSSDTNLRRGIRKSYTSLIHWGERNLSIQVHDRLNATPEIIEEFRQLHITVSGKETRSSESWRIQYRQIMEGQAFLITGRLEGRLVTAALFLHSPLYCYYGVSASIREMFDKPLSHAILWRSVLEAKKRGCSLFEMGVLADLQPASYSDKEKNIAIFKRGFGGHASLQLRIGADDGEISC